MYLLPLYFRLTSIAILTLLILTNSNAVNASSIIESSFNTSQNSSQEPQSTGLGTPPPSKPGSPRPLFSCPQLDRPIVPLVYGRGTDFTRLEQPILLFYIPYISQDIGAVKIVLRDDRRQTVAQYEVRSIEKSGIIKVTIPYHLEVNKNYQIFFELYCGNRPINDDNPHKVLVTWIQRKPESTIDLPSDLEPFEKYQFDRDNHLWYDAIATLSDLHFKNPENPEISEAWSELLESLMIVEELPEDLSNLEWLAEESLVNSELYPL